MWSGIENYNYDSVDLSTEDFKIVTKLKGSSNNNDIEKTQDELSTMYMFEYNPI